MATNDIHVAVSPERVFTVLADPGAYDDWVVGARRIRTADPQWPAPGARIHHQVGVGPLRLNDHTEVLEASAPNRLVLRAHARPLGVARVTMAVAPEPGGARITMVEEAGGRLTRLVWNPILDHLVHVRNVEALRRLKELVEAPSAS